MARSIVQWARAASAALALAACGGDTITFVVDLPASHEAYFAGYVYDGAIGARLQQYKLEAHYRDKKLEGAVAEDGRFLVGPLDPFSDYTITITADGYRLFRSHNARVGLPPELANSDAITEVPTKQTFFYDAYVFPSDLPSPEVSFVFRGLDEEEKLAGKLRLRPASQSSLQSEPEQAPAGVSHEQPPPEGSNTPVLVQQLWTNDEDLQGLPLTREFVDSRFVLEAGELVYGVSYSVDVYDVDGYQPHKSTLRAGFVADTTLSLTPEVTAPLDMLDDTVDTCQAPESPSDTKTAVVTLTFNKDIELGDTSYPGGALEALDDGFSITVSDTDFDKIKNELAPDDGEGTQNRGVELAISGKTLTLSFNPSKGLATSDPDDQFQSVRYGLLQHIFVQPKARPHLAAPLSKFLNESIVCY